MLEEAVVDFFLACSILLLLVFGLGGCCLVVGEWVRDWARRRNRS